MKNNLYKALVFFLGIVLFSSCSDILDKKPLTEVSDGDL